MPPALRRSSLQTLPGCWKVVAGTGPFVALRLQHYALIMPPICLSALCQLVFLLLVLLHNAAALKFYTNPTSLLSHHSTPDTTRISSIEGSQIRDLGSYILQGLDNGHTTADARTTTTALGAQHANQTSQTSNLGTVTSKASYSRASFTSPTPMRSDVWNVTSSFNAKPEAVSKARKCWSDIMTWSSSSAAWWNEHVANRTWPMTSTEEPDKYLTSWTKTIYPPDVSTYKLCDGTPRVNARPTTLSSYYNTTTTTYTRTFAAVPTFRPQPCDPSPQDCHIWYADSSIKQLNENALLKQCGNPAHGTNGPCVFGIKGAVELIYFPVETLGSNGSLCTGNGSTLPATPTGTGPNKITTLGHTFTSGSAYISIQSLSAYIDGFFYTVGPTFTDLILTLASSEVSTQCGGIRNHATQMKWEDLNWPVPASAYSCQDRCGHGRLEDQVAGTTPTQCSTIWSDVNPLLAIPTMITDLAPEFSTCIIESNGNLANFWFDPPIALQPAAAKATPTLSSQPSTTPASVGDSPIKPTPDSTATFGITEPITTTVENVPPPPSQSAGPAYPSSADAAHPSSINVESPNGPDVSLGHSSASRLDVKPTMQHSGPEPVESDAADDHPISQSPTSVVAPVAAPPALSVLTEALSTYTSSSALSNAPNTEGGQSVSQGTLPNLSNGLPDPTDAAGGAIFTFDPVETSKPTATTVNDSPEVPVIPGLSVSTDSKGWIVVSPSGHTATATHQASGGTLPSITGISVPQPLIFTAQDPGGNPRTVVIDGQAVPADGAITFLGQTISHVRSGLAIIPAPTSEITGLAPTVLQAGDLTLTAKPVSGDPNAVVIHDTTLTQGGSAATISGQIVTQASDGLHLIGPSSTIPFSPTTPASKTSSSAPVEIYVLGSVTMSATPDPHYVNGWLVDGTSLSYETGSIVIDGLTITHAWGAMEISGTEMSTVGVAKTATSLPSVKIHTLTRGTSTKSEESTAAVATSEVAASSVGARLQRGDAVLLTMLLTIMSIIVI
ncbi:uncharacterized protein CLAFUR5_13860 [Fulvia fulva]|uniref:Uncharacterized protein n=1 Tax=Passalora fulva TaxID=5499 RepID=A0A9Q8UW21_PASFU|nr:uncharacterized protein CLAFUR5_13860 [Fulvia fulva]UJO24563.1 hypothetical protein CLAFUR5_13860 [Fulvia fulva]WPV37322.1 hypothetical protein CLAFUW7_14031 [Fulvia fulva]